MKQKSGDLSDKKYIRMKREGIHNFIMLPIQYANRNTYKAIESIKNFVVEKFPMMEGAVNSLFGS